MEYKSTATLLGLPLIHVAIGPSEGRRSKRGLARGWLAVGDIAFGVIGAAGGAAFGGIALGGIGVGLISLSGLAVALYALGGFSLGIFSIGGLAVGWQAAMGGGAIAFEYAVGGYASAEHANDTAAREYMTTSIMRYSGYVVAHARWFIVLAFLPAVLALYHRFRSGK
jgi:hypothetical protein